MCWKVSSVIIFMHNSTVWKHINTNFRNLWPHYHCIVECHNFTVYILWHSSSSSCRRLQMAGVYVFPYQSVFLLMWMEISRELVGARLVWKGWQRVNMELFCIVSLITVILVFFVMRSCNVVGSHGPLVFRGRYGPQMPWLTEMYGIITLKITNENSDLV
jgi:hypothetical protein